MDYWSKKIILENLLRDGIISLDRGRVISSIDLANFPGDYPVYSSSAQRNGYFGSYDLFDFDEELITWSVDGGGYFFYRPKHKFSVTNVSGILRILDSEKYDYKFLYYLLVYQHKNQIFDYVDKAHPSVIKKRYFIPEIDITEQTQIATILSKVDEAIAQTEQLIAKYSRIKTGLMQDLLTKGIDENGNIRSEETHEFKDSPLGRIPKEWEFEKLENLLLQVPNSLRSGPFGSALRKSEWVDKGIPYLGIDNVHREKFDALFKRFITYEKFKQLVKYKVRPKDVMITIMGTVGRSCVVPESIEDAISSKHVWTMSFSEEKYFPELICYQLNYSSWILSVFNSESQGGIMQSINSTILKNLLFPKPSIEEQRVINNRLKILNDSLKNYHYSLNKLLSIKNGLMQDLLSGKVRVNKLMNENASI